MLIPRWIVESPLKLFIHSNNIDMNASHFKFEAERYSNKLTRFIDETDEMIESYQQEYIRRMHAILNAQERNGVSPNISFARARVERDPLLKQWDKKIERRVITVNRLRYGAFDRRLVLN